MKKILFISPAFFEYHKIIKSALEFKGYEVDWFDDRPNVGTFGKGLIRLIPTLMKHKVNKYFRSILKHIDNKRYDFVFVIFGQSFTSKMISKIKIKQSQAKFIFYMWDSIDVFKDRLEFSNAFDKCFTFDNVDANRFENFELLPLFIYNYDCVKEEHKYDECFIGTIKKGKYQQLLEIFSYLRSKNQKIYIYMYLQSKLVFWYYKLTDKTFKNAKINDFNYKKLSLSEVNRITNSSRIVIDCPMAKQNGLSMRTFECIAGHKKMITTNQNVKLYDFYNPSNIYVWNDEDNDDDFFENEYEDIDNEVLNRYSLDSWINTIFSGNEEK